jgi:hypothetical protein
MGNWATREEMEEGNRRRLHERFMVHGHDHARIRVGEFHVALAADSARQQIVPESCSEGRGR